MATTSDFRNGLCIKHNNDLWQIVEFQHVKPVPPLQGGSRATTSMVHPT